MLWGVFSHAAVLAFRPPTFPGLDMEPSLSARMSEPCPVPTSLLDVSLPWEAHCSRTSAQVPLCPWGFSSS